MPRVSSGSGDNRTSRSGLILLIRWHWSQAWHHLCDHRAAATVSEFLYFDTFNGVVGTGDESRTRDVQLHLRIAVCGQLQTSA